MPSWRCCMGCAAARGAAFGGGGAKRRAGVRPRASATFRHGGREAGTRLGVGAPFFSRMARGWC